MPISSRSTDRRPSAATESTARREWESPILAVAEAADALVLADHVGHLRLQLEVEGGVLARLPHEQVEQVPLRCERDLGEPRPAWSGRREVLVHEHALGRGELDRGHPPADEPLELLEDPEVGEHLLRHRMHGVAAEVAEEVGVLLEHGDVDALLREQQAEHDARRAAAGDRDRRAELGHPMMLAPSAEVRPSAGATTLRPTSVRRTTKGATGSPVTPS